MPAELNLTSVTKGWIQFLKNNQIVGTQADPKTGRLNYKRQPNVSELMRYLDLGTNFSEDEVRSAIKSVMSRGRDSGADTASPAELPAPTPRLASPDRQPSEVSTTQEPTTDTAPPETGNDQDPAGTPDQAGSPNKRKPRFKYRYKKGLQEAFYDRQGMELSENDIKEIFKILLTPKAKEEPPVDTQQDDDNKSARQEYMRQLKEMIRDVMTPAQRKSLWRALSEENLNEAIVNRADVNAIFKDAAYLRSKPTGIGRIFKGLRKDKINIEDLRSAWADGTEPDGSDGYSNDTNDIKRILRRFGFDDSEINKVFSTVFNNSDNADYNDAQDAPVASKTVQRVANLAREHGIDQSLKRFLEQEFPGDLGLPTGKKMTNEDVRQVFMAIVQEERKGRLRLIKEEEKLKLGRTKK